MKGKIAAFSLAAILSTVDCSLNPNKEVNQLVKKLEETTSTLIHNKELIHDLAREIRIDEENDKLNIYVIEIDNCGFSPEPTLERRLKFQYYVESYTFEKSFGRWKLAKSEKDYDLQDKDKIHILSKYGLLK